MNRILNDQSAITAPVSWLLSRLIGCSPIFWLRLQARVDVWDAGTRGEIVAENNSHTMPLRLLMPRRPTTPGETLRKEYLVPMKISQTEFARRAGMDPQQVNRIVHGRQAITAPIAWKFSKVLGIKAWFWMDRQIELDVWKARKTMLPTGVR